MPASPGLVDRPLTVDHTRARQPDATGFVERDGVRVAWERYGEGSPTILLLPTWTIIHSRFWKGQIPYLARHYRVVTFDGRGNGRSDRPARTEAYSGQEFVADAVAVLDATGTARALAIGLSMGAGYLLRLAVDHPERLVGAAFIGSTVGLATHEQEEAAGVPFDAQSAPDEGWARYTAASWRRDWPGFARFFFGEMFSEPHSTKQIEDAVGWALETDPETMITAEDADYLSYEIGGARLTGARAVVAMARRVRCPCFVIHGTDDHIAPFESGRRLAELLGAHFVAFEAAGHSPLGRDPVKVNLLIRDFVRRLPKEP